MIAVKIVFVGFFGGGGKKTNLEGAAVPEGPRDYLSGLSLNIWWLILQTIDALRYL